MPKKKSVSVEPALIDKATKLTLELKSVLTEITADVVRSTNGKKPLNKNGRPLAKVAGTAAETYPEIMTGRFDKEDYDNRLDFDEKTESLFTLIDDTLDTFKKRREGNSADIEYLKRQIYSALVAASKDDNQYEYFKNQLATEYEGQGKRPSDNNKGDNNPPKT